MNKNIILCILSVAFTLLSPTAEARIKRSQSAKVEFKAGHPCPANGATKGPCKGYVIDHIKPLACGGADAPSNMQWQTEADGKAKDKWERKGCEVKQVADVKPMAAPVTSTSSHTCHVGPRGGRYTLSPSGRKKYGGC